MNQIKPATFLFILFLLLLNIYVITYGDWILVIPITFIFYFFHLIFMSDHIYYSASSDYNYNIHASIKVKLSITNDTISIQKNLLNTIDCCFIPVVVKSSISGYFFDPYIEIQSNNKNSRQYFERGSNGIRLINISNHLSSLKSINTHLKIKSIACKLIQHSDEAICFTNEDYLKKSTLIVSPHADDAELAAFGYYKQADNIFIATITAGESEAQQYLNIAGNQQDAALLKGRLRAWDSIAVPLWAKKQNCAIQLGYPCSSLSLMSQHPEIPVASKGTGKNTTLEYRQFNSIELSSNTQPLNTWSNLIEDLKEILINQQPEVIITPHPLLDSHSDHQHATFAIVQACLELGLTPIFLCYANHYHQTDQYPFGLENTDVTLPPYFSDLPLSDKIFSLELSTQDKFDKVIALTLMHDLNRPIKFKKILRRTLQRIIGRSSYPYGQDEYFRKAIRNQELFWVINFDHIKLMVKSIKH
ncbi:MAG: PIG-L family deacetylase [Cellvibrio sp.]|nr:PIG-L family deacetylase [Cellvibrio sp.]